MKTKSLRSMLACMISLLMLLSSFGGVAVFADDDPVAAAEAAINEIGLVSYRASVLSAIEAAEAVFNNLDDTQKGQVSNAQILADARDEYDHLTLLAADLKMVASFDTTTVEGWDHDQCDFEAVETENQGDHTGPHWVIDPIQGDWSIWQGTNIDLSEYNFNDMMLRVNVLRNNEEDGMVTVILHNQAGQKIALQHWFGEFGLGVGEWGTMEVPFSEGQDIVTWQTFTEDTFQMDSPLVTMELRNLGVTIAAIEVDGIALYNEAADVQALVDEANAVVDQIASIGEITSAEQNDAVIAARGAFDALSANQQKLVVNADALPQLELVVRQYKTAANVVAAIESIGEVTADNYADKGDDILSAREAYDTYYNKYNENTLITNLDALTAAEEAYNGFLAAEKETDIAALEEFIKAIGEVNQDNSAEALAKIEAAEAARDALAEKYGDEVLGEVGNLADLTEARQKYDELNPAITLGDVNGDTKVDAQDALMALQHSVQIKILEGDAFTAADVNHDAKVDASDALLMLQRSVGLITEFPSAQ